MRIFILVSRANRIICAEGSGNENCKFSIQRGKEVSFTSVTQCHTIRKAYIRDELVEIVWKRTVRKLRIKMTGKPSTICLGISNQV